MLFRISMIFFPLLLGYAFVFGCSMYKITVGGKTLVGNNEDSWRNDPIIWFEPESATGYAACFVDYAERVLRKVV